MFHSFVAKHLGFAKDGSMRQGFNRFHADEGGSIQISDAKLTR